MDKTSLNISPSSVTLNLPAEHSAVSAKEIKDLLSQQKVSYGLNTDAIEKAAQLSTSSEAIKNLTIAEGTAPIVGKPAIITPTSNIGDIVVPGDVIATIEPATPGTPGTTVTGEAIEPPALPELVFGENTAQLNDTVIATRYGTLNNRMNKPIVVPLLTISSDKIEACMDIHPNTTQGKQITYGILMKDIAEAGITFGIEENTVRQAVDTQKVQRMVTVAIGYSAEPACKADFLCHVTLNGRDPRDLVGEENPDPETIIQPRLVEADDLICTETPATAQIIGKTVFGEEIKPPRSTAKGTSLKIGDGFKKQEDSGDYFCNIEPLGYLTLNNNTLSVEPIIKISEDAMTVTLTLHHQDDNAPPLTQKIINTILERLSVTYGIRQNIMDEALNDNASNTQTVHYVIAEGRLGMPGEDEYLDYLIEHQANAGQATADGRIDFHERSTIKNVEIDQCIARIMPATKGQSQIDVHGNATPSQAGKTVGFSAGDGVVLKDDCLYATETGALLVQGNTVSVTDIFEWEGNVGNKSGNLHHKTGAIQIKGDIESGFSVDAKGHVIVAQNIDNATVTAGADIEVKGGIIQREKSEARTLAAGSVTAKFAQNAKIYAYQNIIINDSAINSTLHAKGSITITKGKGHLVGGHARAGKSITVKNLGSPAAAITHAIIEVDPKQYKAITLQLSEKKAMLDDRSKSFEELDEIAKQIQKLQHQLRGLTNKIIQQGEVIIEGTVYPGVTITILDQTYTFKEEKRRCRVKLTGARVINISPLK